MYVITKEDTHIMSKKVEDYVRSIPDFPEPGIIFRDVTSVIPVSYTHLLRLKKSSRM